MGAKISPGILTKLFVHDLKKIATILLSLTGSKSKLKIRYFIGN